MSEPEPVCHVCGDTAHYMVGKIAFCKRHKHFAIAQQKTEIEAWERKENRQDAIGRLIRRRKRKRINPVI